MDTSTTTRAVNQGACLAIKPDLIFLWDEAWFPDLPASRRFIQQLAQAIGAARTSRTWLHGIHKSHGPVRTGGGARREPVRRHVAEQRLSSRSTGAEHPRLSTISTRSCPVSALRQGSMLLVKDVIPGLLKHNSMNRIQPMPTTSRTRPADCRPGCSASGKMDGRFRASCHPHRGVAGNPPGRRKSAR